MPSSVIFFANKSLPASCVDLGRFVLNLDMPWEDCCPDSAAAQEEAGVAPEPQLYPIIEAGVQRGAKMDMGFIRSTFPAASKSHVLRDPEQHCKQICNQRRHESQSWLKDVLHDGYPVYMVVGLHTVTKPPNNRDRVNTVLGVAFLGMPFLPMGTSYAMGGPLIAGGNQNSKTLPAADDKIIAIEYRQINLRATGTRSGSGSGYIEGDVRETVDLGDILEVFGTGIDDGMHSIIVTPVGEDSR